MNKEKFTRTCDLRIDVPGLYQLSYLAPTLAVSLLYQYPCSGGRQSEVIKPYTALLARDHAQVTIQPFGGGGGVAFDRVNTTIVGKVEIFERCEMPDLIKSMRSFSSKHRR